MKKFAVIGTGGYVAPKHFKAIYNTGNQVVAAHDISDSVGFMDRFSCNIPFFTDTQKFVDFCRDLASKDELHYVTICTPNHTHQLYAHIGMDIGCDVVCEKPLALYPSDLFYLKKKEKRSGRRVNAILQSRLHPLLIDLRKEIKEPCDKPHDVVLQYVTARGDWYHTSWKGDEKLSGGLMCNIGVHLVDVMSWIFGRITSFDTLQYKPEKVEGVLYTPLATIKYLLSIEKTSVPTEPVRTIYVDGRVINLSEFFSDLHTKSYEEILQGKGFGVDDARVAIECIDMIRKENT